MTAAVTSTPVVANELRERWAQRVLRNCMFLAYLHGITETHHEGDTGLQALPSAIHQFVFTQCQELISEYSRKEAQGIRPTRDELTFEQQVNAILWDFLKPWRREDVVESRLHHAGYPRTAP